jgi:hypothetical protein
MPSRFNAYSMEDHMDEIFSIGQFFCLMFLVCGAYLSFAYARLANAEYAKTVTPDRPTLPAMQTGPGSAGFNVFPETNA